MRRGTALLIGLALVAAACSGSATKDTTTSTSTTVVGSDWQAVVDEYAEAFAATVPAGGAIVAVWRDGQLFVAAAGRQPSGEPIPANGSWRIASVTKSFVATATLGLADDGLIELDVPAATYLSMPEVPESVSVRDLLEHRSGIADFVDVEYLQSGFAESATSRDPVALSTAALEANTVPESPIQWYSSTNYLLLGLLIEEVSGRSVDEVLEEMCDRAGLTDTYLAGEEARDPAPIGAFASLDGVLTPIDADRPYAAMAAGTWTAGAMVSNAEDLVHFLRALFGGELISSGSLAEMLPTTPGAYGLGIEHFAAFSTDVYGHSGGIPGYGTQVGYAPDRDVAFVSLVTSDVPSGDLDQLTYDLYAAALAD